MLSWNSHHTVCIDCQHGQHITYLYINTPYEIEYICVLSWKQELCETTVWSAGTCTYITQILFGATIFLWTWYLFRQAVKQQTVTWSKVYSVLWRHMVLLGGNEFAKEPLEVDGNKFRLGPLCRNSVSGHNACIVTSYPAVICVDLVSNPFAILFGGN